MFVYFNPKSDLVDNIWSKSVSMNRSVGSGKGPRNQDDKNLYS